MSIDELKEQVASMRGFLDEAVAPLSERLDRFGVVVYWGYSSYRIGRQGNKNLAFYLTDEKLEELLVLSDEELREYLESLEVL